MKAIRCLFSLLLLAGSVSTSAQQKAIFIILDGISADALEKTETPFIDEISSQGGYTRAFTGGMKGGYSESPTVSAVGYNHVLTGTWSNKHNVWDNDIREPNYHYWNIFRIVKHANPEVKTAIFSTWLDNRTKLLGEGLPQAGNIKMDYAFDGFELDKEKFPHDADKRYIFNIDEHVSMEAARYIAAEGPDLSWVYLEYTDDIGHRHGDSPEYTEAIRLADAQVGRIWQAVQQRMQKTSEQWMVVVTTDHGRDVQTGKHHGGQSDRERTIWISTNCKDLNTRFGNGTAAVDIMPSIVRHLNIRIPEKIEWELDGIPFIGKLSVANLQAEMVNKKIRFQWDVLDETGIAKIFLASTDNTKEARADDYRQVDKVAVKRGKVLLPGKYFRTPVSKILIKAPNNSCTFWVIR
jgi:predicted AlkP superfamily pyrophosphatase or phosphodiesterase